MATGSTRIVLGTATPGGGFPAYGWPYAEVLNATDPTLVIEPINTKGSTENAPRLEKGDLDLGLVTGEVTYEAISGIGGPKATSPAKRPWMVSWRSLCRMKCLLTFSNSMTEVIRFV